MGAQVHQQQAQDAGGVEVHGQPLAAVGEDGAAAEQQGDGGESPPAHHPVEGGGNGHPLLVLRQHIVGDELQQEHQARQGEDQCPAGQGVVLSAGADEAGLHDLRDLIPQPEPQDHRQGAGDQGDDQQCPLLLPGDVLAEDLRAPDLQVAGDGFSLFPIAHGRSGSSFWM